MNRWGWRLAGLLILGSGLIWGVSWLPRSSSPPSPWSAWNSPITGWGSPVERAARLVPPLHRYFWRVPPVIFVCPSHPPEPARGS